MLKEVEKIKGDLQATKEELKKDFSSLAERNE